MKRLLIILLIICIIVIASEYINGVRIKEMSGILGPYYITEGDIAYEYYIGYIPPSPPTDEVPTSGGWIVTYLD